MRASFVCAFIWSTLLVVSEGFVPLSCSKRSRLLLRLKIDDHKKEPDVDDSSSSIGPTLDEMDAETQQLEQESSRKVRQTLLFPYYLGKAVNVAVGVLLLSSIILNMFGLSYTVRDHWITIDTLENREFQDELVRSMRELTNNQP